MLSGSTDVNLIVVNLNLKTWGQEGVETNDEVWVSLEEVGDTADYTWRVNAFGEWVEREREEGGEGGGWRGGREREEEGSKGKRHNYDSTAILKIVRYTICSGWNTAHQETKILLIVLKNADYI